MATRSKRSITEEAVQQVKNYTGFTATADHQSSTSQLEISHSSGIPPILIGDFLI